MDELESRSNRALTAAAVIVVVAALFAARNLLVPFALALVVAILLAPAVNRLERFRFGRITATVTVMSLTCAVVGVLLWFVTQQIADLVGELPHYVENIRDKLQSLRGGVIEKASDAVEELQAGLETEVEPSTTPQPQEVKVVPPGGLDGLSSRMNFLLGPLGMIGTLGLVLVIATFLLLQRFDLRDRLVHLVGDGRIEVTSQAMDEVSSRVTRYLLMQAAINGIHGAAVGLGMWLLGVPNPLIWGITSALLRFVPYLGPILAAVMPCALALAVFEGWNRPLMVIGYFVVLELVSNNVLEPWLYGSSAGVSSFAVVASAVFWTWCWGPVGLLLAMPMTVFLVVAGKHVPQLGFLHVLLGEQGAVDPGVRLYRRMLAMDQNGVADVVERAAAETKSIAEIGDSILVPALVLAAMDHRQGSLSDRRREFLAQMMRDVVAELGEELPPETEPDAAAGTVLCVPAGDEFDEIVGSLLCQVLAGDGHECRLAPIEGLVAEKVDLAERSAAQAICISVLAPSGLTRARYLAKRLRERFPDMPLVIGLWSSTLDPEKGLQRLRVPPPCGFATTLTAAKALVAQGAGSGAVVATAGPQADAG